MPLQHISDSTGKGNERGNLSEQNRGTLYERYRGTRNLVQLCPNKVK